MIKDKESYDAGYAEALEQIEAAKKEAYKNGAEFGWGQGFDVGWSRCADARCTEAEYEHALQEFRSRIGE